MQAFLKLSLVFICLIAIACGTQAQGIIRGFIKDKETGQSVIFQPIGLVGTQYGTVTDENGYYSLTKIPPGTYTIIISSLDYEEITENVTVENDRVVARNFLLEKKITTTDVVEINGDKSDQRNNTNVSVETIRPQDIKRIPGVGGQPDLAQMLTTLPGFISTGDQGGQIYVRGGSPVQNKVLLDGMIVYNAFHSIGLFSVFDTEIIGNADVYTGGFGAQFGGRISSVMDITTRDGNKREHRGKLSVSPFGANAIVEGPLKKLKENGSGISYILSVKHSYLDKTSPVLYPYINDGQGLPFTFTDIYGKISFGGNNGSKFNIFGFDFKDAVSNYRSLASLAWENVGVGGNFVIVPATSAVLISGNFAKSKYNVALKEDNLPNRSSSINGFNFGLDFKYVIKNDVLKYGIEIVGFSTNYSTFNPLGVNVEYGQNTTELDLFGTYKFNRGNWVVEPGIRFQYYGSLSVFSPEPRLSAKYKVNERLRIKGATGIYTQNLMATNSDRDVVNLFYGFLGGPENIQTQFTKPDLTVREVKNPLQRAIHYIFGFEFDITERLNLNVEGYYRKFTQISNTNRNKVFADTPANADRPDALKKDFVLESGWAAGCDVVFKYEDKRNYLNLVYSLGKVRRWDGFQWYYPVFDRRHNVNVVASRYLGKEKQYEFNLRWNMGSGLAFTQTQGYYQPQGVGQGVALDYLTSNSSSLGIQYADLNKGRLPYYHRLDMSIKRSFKLANKAKLEVNIGLTNAYNRANVFYVDRVTSQRVNQLPFMPNAGINFNY
jgi:CarboxypepD_reg-like domain/TonB-dependent Receptor Plug Domain